MPVEQNTQPETKLSLEENIFFKSFRQPETRNDHKSRVFAESIGNDKSLTFFLLWDQD